MDRKTLTTMVRTHQAEIFRYLRYLGARDANLAEDLAQDTFLAAFRSQNAPLTTDVRRQAAWLRGVARNVFLMHCRKVRTTPVRFDSEGLERAEAVWANRFLRDGDGFDFVAALRRCLGKLGERQMGVLRMRYWEKRSRGEMAGRLRMSEDGVKSMLRRLRSALKGCVEQSLADERGVTPREGVVVVSREAPA